jgi:hypothetical protein
MVARKQKVMEVAEELASVKERTNGKAPEFDLGVAAEEPTEVAENVGFTPEMFEEMRSHPDLALGGEDDEEPQFCPVDTPGKFYTRMHPGYDMVVTVIPDFRKSDGKQAPHLVIPRMESRIPHGMGRAKRLIYCQRYVDGLLTDFLWLADWYEKTESPNSMHQSLASIVAKAKEGFGQIIWTPRAKVYRWYRWPKTMGEQPPAYWPERAFYDVVRETFAGRIIMDVSHELFRSIGEEA